MEDRDKTTEQLIDELVTLRQRVAELEASEVQHKQTEEVLRYERDLLGRLMQTSPAGIAVVDHAGQITFANQRAEQVLGLTKDQITQRTYNAPTWRITDYAGNPFPDKDLPFSQIMSTGQPVSDVRHAIEWPDGQRVLLSINASPLFNDAGQLDGMIATFDRVVNKVLSA